MRADRWRQQEKRESGTKNEELQRSDSVLHELSAQSNRRELLCEAVPRYLRQEESANKADRCGSAECCSRNPTACGCAGSRPRRR